MTAALEAVASVGAEQLASAVWQLTPPLACIAAVGILFWLGVRRELRRRALRTPTEPNPVAEFWARPKCPWCDTRECLDRFMCTCHEPCGSWLCVVKEASRG